MASHGTGDRGIPARDAALGLAAAITAIGLTAYRLAHVAKMVEQ